MSKDKKFRHITFAGNDSYEINGRKVDKLTYDAELKEQRDRQAKQKGEELAHARIPKEGDLLCVKSLLDLMNTLEKTKKKPITFGDMFEAMGIGKQTTPVKQKDEE